MIAYLKVYIYIAYYNRLLHKFCIENNKENKNYKITNYFYYDLDKYLFINGKIDKKFIDLSNMNIHLRWEPMISYHIKILNKYCGLSKNYLVDIKKEEDKYLKYKINKLKEKGFIKKQNTLKQNTLKQKSNNIKTYKNKQTNKNTINNFINKI